MVLARDFCFGKELEDCQGGSFVNVRRAFTNTPLTGWKRPHAQGKGAGKGRRPPLLSEPSAARLGVWGQSPRELPPGAVGGGVSQCGHPAARFFPSRGGRRQAVGVGLFSGGENLSFPQRFLGCGGGTPNIYFLFILVVKIAPNRINNLAL